jgi:hypothetical protein
LAGKDKANGKEDVPVIDVLDLLAQVVFLDAGFEIAYLLGQFPP